MPFFITDDQLIHYEFCGQRQFDMHTPALLLHGNGEDMSIFADTVKPLLSTHAFVLMDSRHHGESALADGAEDEPFSLHYNDMAEDALALMEGHLALREYDIVGYSDGGIIALIMAARSKCVRRVVTIGANADPLGLTFTARHMIKKAYAHALKTGDHRAAELQRLMLEEPSITRSDLAGIIAEVTVVRGEKDRFISKKHSMLIADAIPHGSHLTLPGAGHGIPETHPKELSDIIRNAL